MNYRKLENPFTTRSASWQEVEAFNHKVGEMEAMAKRAAHCAKEAQVAKDRGMFSQNFSDSCNSAYSAAQAVNSELELEGHVLAAKYPELRAQLGI